MPEGVVFQEAIDFLKQKIDLPTRAWTDLMEGMHARAFVVAGAVQADLISDFHKAVTQALENGTTLADFRLDFDRIVAKHGWSYNGSRGWRSRVIYNTNLRMARASGRWAQIQRVKKRRPYLKYSVIDDGRTRPEHKAWNGTVLPVDDDFWRTHFPPNGWNCRCRVISVSEADLKKHDLKISKAPPIAMETRTINTPNGHVNVQAPKGIDTGFGYNVGEAAWGRGADVVAQETHGPWTALIAPGGNRPLQPGKLASVVPKASLGQRVTGETALRQALTKALGSEEAVFTDPMGARVAVGPAIVDHMIEKTARLDGREAFFALIPELIEDPSEIWAGFAASVVSGRVALRRRYVKLFDIGKDRTLGLVADLDGGRWSGYTLYRGNMRGLKNLRSGLRIYEK